MIAGLVKIVSGGQTGVDRAALDVAGALGLDRGGWIPRGRRTEAGPLPPEYPLVETPSRAYRQRTAWNVRDADGTLVLTRGRPRGGTALTLEVARRLGRPFLVVDLAGDPDPAVLAAFVGAHRIRVLNVAGPRESGAPGIGAAAAAWLRAACAAGRSRPAP